MNIELLNEILLSENCVNLIRENEEYIFSLIPELKKSKGFNQNNNWHIYDVYEHILKVIENVPNDLRLRMAALFHDVGKPVSYVEDDKGIGHFPEHWTKSKEFFEKFADENCINPELKKAVSKLIECHDKRFEKMNDQETFNVIKNFDKEELKLLFKLKRADLLGQNPEYHNLLNDYELQEKRIIEKYYIDNFLDER